MKRIVVVTPDSQAPETIRASFHRFKVQTAVDPEMGLLYATPPHCDYVFVDVGLLADPAVGPGQTDYRKALHPFWQAFPAAQIVVMATQERIRDAVAAVKAGASNYLTYPVTPEEVSYIRQTIEADLRFQGELDYLRDHFWQQDALDLVRTSSPAVKAVFKKVRLVAETKTTVLLTGETGTGKNVVAKLLHRHSTRKDRQFISVHCGAIPDTLLESELFGHEKGAFTGAVRRKLGRFEIANGGTILLDEVGTITAAMQVKLLQVLQDQTILRVGGEQPIEVDVRILAATNIDLKRAVEQGTFRSDLFFRLNVFPIELPPLRERREDIPTLVETFLVRLNGLYAKGIAEVHPIVMEAFAEYPWPGNVRELESLMERAYILETSRTLTPEGFPTEIFGGEPTVGQVSVNTDAPLAQARRKAMEAAERVYLKEQLAAHQGKIGPTAKASGITVRQLHTLMTRHGLRKEDFRRGSPARRKSGSSASDH